ncbi:MAG: alpha-L-arabinofuranosidase C-terminal domain-containing protein, partial [Prevotella sp.]|nr:alpha-L-arabinofuranosidase C-terminal domain-containing protein [Prevotella sp.]
LRTDLVKDLEDLKPGVFRFPGGCIVEGADTATRYQWKNTVGPAENRPLNENRWNYTSKGRAFPQYFQSLGLGFYEYFLLSEKIGAEPLPILSCGMVCQYQNKGDEVHVALDEMDPYIQDAIDLVEFANGATDTRWGAVRAKMGHPEPFNLKYIGIGNEQWGPLYPERLKMFVKALRKHCPDIKIIGSSGPKASGDRFDDGWAAMRQLDVDLVDEHYYMPPQWFLDNAARYDAYPRTGPKVFAGEYAAHDKSIKDNQPDVERNNFAAALSEAAFMTGIERNADIVLMATYAPLFAHVDGWQWRPDLIWFDNLSSVRSANWYVQMMYSTNKGTHVLPITENKASVTGTNGLYASAVYDAGSNEYVIKMVNASYEDKDVTVDIRGAKGLRKAVVTSLHADDKASNSMSDKRAVVPVYDETDLKGNSMKLLLRARTFAVYRLSR